mmetsp:Transcript_14362/g.23711  ORF Transcript_14362/g.23711 Transcript_14362/m.23711 type:complete len:133 (-) Transcript_14362:32-430(-)
MSNGGLNDKVLHFLVSFILTIVIFFPSGYLISSSVRKRLVFAGFIAFTIGLVKELGDGWLWEWPWCPPCSADIRDLFANVIGIVLALLGIVHVRAIVQVVASMKTKKPCTATSTTTGNTLTEVEQTSSVNNV